MVDLKKEVKKDEIQTMRGNIQNDFNNIMSAPVEASIEDEHDVNSTGN